MELAEQKKRTSTQMYPVDWMEMNLGENSILKARIGWQGLTTAEYLNSGDYYLITGTDFSNGFIDWENCVFVKKVRYDQDKNIQILEGDILVTKDGTIGKVAYIDKVPLPTTLNSGVFVIRPKKENYHPRYLYHILMSEHFKDFLGKLTAGSTISHLYQKDFVHYNFPLPPTLTEQKAIATALSDVDSLISSLDKLISKKKAIKQGAMQELLTPPHKGGKRLPGFSGDWEEKKLGDIGDVQMCKRIFSYQTTKRGDVPFFKIGTFGKEPDAFISWELYNDFRKKYPFPKKGFLLISASGTIGRTVEYNGEDAYYQDSNIIWIDNDGRLATNEYLKYIFKVISYNTEGSTIKRLYNSIVKSAIFYCPPSLKEQNSIARILSDMDLEIESLENKKTKYQEIKQGMMQELLTGKTRLI
jgi:type I restriction enzyme, S subunit